MNTPDRVSSSRNLRTRMPSARPGTVRPSTGMRPMTTGLLMPKSSRGKTAVSLRRQVHDKSYWTAVLSAKIKDLQTEIGRLGRAAEKLQKDQARSGLLKQSAEQSARDLQSKNQTLIVLNEYFERIRLADALQDVKDEVHLMSSENDQLAEHLEQLYAAKRATENEHSVLQQTLTNQRNRAMQLRRRLDDEQQKRFVVLESKNRALNERTSSLNAKLAQLKRAQQRLERLHSADGGSLQRRELLHALKRTRELQQQVDELRNSSGGQAPEAKKLQMLAEAKLGKQRVDSLIEQKEQLQRQLNELQTKLEAYNQPDTLTKIAELKAKQTMMQEFLGDFQVKYETELNLKQELSRQVEIAGKRKQRIERQVKRLQVRRSPELTQLHSTWRSLKMDLESIRQLESKAETEAKELQQSCISLRNDLQRFEKVDDLRDQLNLEWESEKRLNEQLVVRHQTALENVQQKKEQVDKLNDEIEQTDLANRISVMEAKLLQLQIAKRTASDTLQQFDYVDLKTNALQMVTKLNQRLLGF